jgi:hypothetical protein
MANNLALRASGALFLGASALLPFVAGAGCSAILINWCRRHHLANQFALPPMLEAALLLGSFFVGGVTGAIGYDGLGFLFSVPLACLLILLTGTLRDSRATAI